MLIATTETAVVTRALSFDDLPQILALERAAFIPPLQADDRRIRRRFELRHRMIGAFSGERLVGMIACCNGRFDPNDRSAFPSTFDEFSSQPPMRDANAVFIYNLEVAPAHRGATVPRTLIARVLDDAVQRGLNYAVADGRMPSYAGSDTDPQEQIRRNETFRDAVDRYLAGGPALTEGQYREDPILALYHRITGCRFGWIATDFVDDPPSGNMRVVLYGPLTEWQNGRVSSTEENEWMHLGE